MYSISLRNAEHTRHYSISRLSAGWAVRVEQQGQLTRHVVYQDWHRVERMLALFRLEVSDLTHRGWQQTQP